MAIPLNQHDYIVMNCLQDVIIEFGLTISLMRGARTDKHCAMYLNRLGFPQALHGPQSLSRSKI